MTLSGKAEDIPGTTKLAILNGKIEEIKGVIDTIGKAENLHIKTIVITNRGSIKHIISPTKVIKMQPKTLLGLISK
jgi:hypothetical protein